MQRNNRNPRKTRSLFWVTGIAVVALSGCSNSPSQSPPPQSQLHVAVVPQVKPGPPHKPICKQTTFGRLKIDSIRIVGNVVHIMGETDLPDNSVLRVSLDVAGRSDDAESIAVGEDATVNSGHFSADLTRPSRPEFLHNQCVVTLLFSPFVQTPGVQAVVGADGQHLAGSAVDPIARRDPRVMKTLQVEKTLPVHFHSSSQDQNARRINPNAYAAGSPERALAEFLAAWQRKNYGAMRKVCQATWLSGQTDPENTLRDWFDIKTLLGAKIEGRDEDGDNAVKLSATISYAVGPDVQTHHIHVMVIKEERPYTPDQNGKWGVNPLSAIKEQ